MGLLDFIKTQPKPAGSRFAFADGSTYSPEEYGYLAVRVGSQSAVAQTNACFGEGTIGASLGLAEAIRGVRFAADIYTTMLEVAVYMWYAASILKVKGDVMARITKGARDGLSELIAPNGRRLDTDLKEALVQQAYAFVIAIEKDVEIGSTRDPGVLQTQSLPSTALLLDFLLRGNSDDASVVNKWRTELTTSSGLWIQDAIESSTLASMQTLNKGLRVRFEQ